MQFLIINPLNSIRRLYTGVEIGDIGKKYGYDPIDNGFIAFRNYRIPRMNMLMRFSQVTPQGELKKMGNDQIMYGCMLIMRNVMCLFASLLLSISTTIAVRYSCVRRQTPGENGYLRRASFDCPHKTVNYIVKCRVADHRISDPTKPDFARASDHLCNLVCFVEISQHCKRAEN